MRAVLRQAGFQEQNLPPAKKRIKADPGEIMQKLVDIYAARGNYMPYGSVSTASTYTKNIQSNQYPLCLRRFSGYKRPASALLKTSNHVNPAAPPHIKSSAMTNVIDIHNIPPQAPEKIRLISAPMLASLLDDKERPAVPSVTAHPLVSTPTQGISPQQHAPILTDLLGGPEGLNGADKKNKKVRKRRTTSDTAPTPPPLSNNLAVNANFRKRKPSDSAEEVKRELVTVKNTVDADRVGSVTSARAQLPPNVSIIKQPNARITTPTTAGHSPLAKLLHEDTKPKTAVKTIIMTTADILEPNRSRLESTQSADVKPPSTAGVKLMTSADVKPQIVAKSVKRKSVDEKKVIKQSSLPDMSNIKEKKLKRSESNDVIKLKSEAGPPSPSRKTAAKLTIKSKVSKSPVPKSQPPPLTVKSSEDRMSPKEKSKKATVEKKKKPPKSPINSDQGQKQNSDLFKMGFYGASNLKSLPKIPKRKPGDATQASPTSPTPPPLTQKTSTQQKSPVPMEWQRSSPVANRQPPQKSDDSSSTTAAPGRSKSVASHHAQQGDASGKRPALLPTPATPPISLPQQRNNLLHRKESLVDVIHRLNRQHSSTGSSSNSSSTKSSSMSDQQQKRLDSPDEINSPDDKDFVQSEPVAIPVSSAEPEDPASPTPELITKEPKAIPLDSKKQSFIPMTNSQQSSSTDHMSAFRRQQGMTIPISFSSKAGSSIGDRMEEEMLDRDMALGCN